jgi:ubiquinol-cytochrome c reductase iron-sulfur subunit
MANHQDEKVDKKKRSFLIAATAVTGVIGAGTISVPFLSSMTPSERAKAAGAPVEVDVSKIEVGAMITSEWRGQPVWIINRSQAMLEGLKKNDSDLSDPNLDVISQQPNYCKNATRSLKPNLIVLVGICTHLGCSPTAKLQTQGDMGENWNGGFFCPCHGSKFDLAGRVYKGSPAPINLVVPPHKYINENTLLLGEDNKG